MLKLSLQPKQGLAYRSPATELLYGGAAGGGKSHLMRVALICWCQAIPGLQCYLFRRTFPELTHNHLRGPTGFSALLAPLASAGVWIRGEREVIFPNGSRIYLCHCRNHDDIYAYQGAQMHVLAIDELTHWTEPMYRFLRSRVRLGGFAVPPRYEGQFPRILCSANPGGIGHLWVKSAFVDDCAALQLRRMDAAEGGMLRQYVPALLEDNPAMWATDPDYEQKLEGMGDPNLVKAMRYGLWEIFAGQMFAFDERWHVIEPMPIPEGAELLMTFDWGFGAPFSVGWWWVDADGRLVRFAEWYGWNEGAGGAVGGLKLADDDVALGIKAHERELGISGLPIRRIGGHDCAAAKPRYEGGGEAASTRQTFLRHGLDLHVIAPSRKVKIREFHGRLRVPRDRDGNRTGELPMLVVFRGCRQFIRTIPSLMVSRKDPEDIESEGSEDHIYDEACLACMHRPLGQMMVVAGDPHASRAAREEW